MKITDLFTVGKVHHFNEDFISKIRPTNSLLCSRAITSPTNNCETYHDPVIFALQDMDYTLEAEENKNKTYFFMSEEIFTALATSHRSNFPWNISFYRFDNKYSFYAADASSLMGRIHTFNENLNGDLPEEEKDMIQQCMDSHLVSENFANQSIKKDKFVEHKLEDLEGYPKITDDPLEKLPSNKLYKYKRIEIDSTNIIICRFTIDAIEEKNGEQNPVLIRAVNDIGKGAWISRWDRDSALIKSDIVKDNLCKFFKWMLLANVNKVQDIKMAYTVKSENKKEDAAYKIIKVENLNVVDLCRNFGFQWREFFASLNMVLDHLKGLTEGGEYVLSKTQFKNILTVYQVPEQKEDGEDEENNGDD